MHCRLLVWKDFFTIIFSIRHHPTASRNRNGAIEIDLKRDFAVKNAATSIYIWFASIGLSLALETSKEAPIPKELIPSSPPSPMVTDKG